jgi:hypothetical protein
MNATFAQKGHSAERSARARGGPPHLRGGMRSRLVVMGSGFAFGDPE